jgi:tripartite-type tricarboxylate transporter receptor subunit TctC
MEVGMKLTRRKFLHLVVSALPAVSRIAWAQAYPTEPVRLIATTAAGGTQDVLARLIGQWLAERIGKPFIIESRSGGGTNIGTEAVVRAPADGYTLLFVSPANATNATLYDKLNFNFVRDIAPVASISREPQVMVVNPSDPPRQFRSSSPTPSPTRAKSTWLRPAMGRGRICPASCSR